MRKACPNCQNTGWCHAFEKCELSGVALRARVDARTRRRLRRAAFDARYDTGFAAGIWREVEPR